MVMRRMKTPPDYKELENDLARVRKDKEQAIENQKFEQAAKLRDQANCILPLEMMERGVTHHDVEVSIRKGEGQAIRAADLHLREPHRPPCDLHRGGMEIGGGHPHGPLAAARGERQRDRDVA